MFNFTRSVLNTHLSSDLKIHYSTTFTSPSANDFEIFKDAKMSLSVTVTIGKFVSNVNKKKVGLFFLYDCLILSGC